ncbi:MAG: protein-disulfide reductase DsbD [Steroidobacteraceae bacterium]|jgi:thiol:disulfide interchange protein DsbD|nr:protein-disulfide reductase DsbD [Steroidobacteraceae bacterium]
MLPKLLLLLALVAGPATAQGLLGGVSQDDEFLHPDEAFQLSADAHGGDAVALRWVIADGYYLYRHRMAARSEDPGVTVGELSLPPGKPKTDEFFGEIQAYYQQAEVLVPVSRAPGADAFSLKVTYQGCADAGLCYPPITKTVNVALPPAGTPAPSIAAPGGAGGGMVAEQDRLAAMVSTGNLALVMATFFGFGLLLAFTPCVLPMIPILSGIIAGQGTQATPSRSFMLSLVYVLGMALTYTVAGAAFAAAGQQAQAFFQQPWIIVVFALLFVALALAMFGMYELQLPSSLQTRLSVATGRQRAGTFTGTFVMGALSALVVTACVAPPLVAALAVIGQTGDVLRGALALFALSLGMGAPLLLVGVAGGKLLPQAGPWMNTVKALFGVMFLGVAVWMLERILPPPLTLALWALLAFVGGYYFGGFGRREERPTAGLRVARGVGLFAMAYGIVMLVGAAAGAGDPLQPLKGTPLLRGEGGATATARAEELPFRKIASLADLDRELAAARAAGRPVMVDFYADWCVSCKEMEKYTFSDTGVQAALGDFVLLKADVTANNADDQALMRHFGIFGPPTTAFYGPAGNECRGYRLIGFVAAEPFRQHLASFRNECRA